MRTISGWLWIWSILAISGLAQSPMVPSSASWSNLVNSPLNVLLLPGHQQFIFTLYGIPGSVDQLRELVQVMQKQRLGNGFDPGPSSRASARPLFEYLSTVGWPVITYPGCADMQIKGGKCVLGPDDLAAMEPLRKNGLFHAIQLGEWGYYFHNLAPNERWWRDVYGSEFDAMKHLMKPPGLAGYDRPPTSRRECYEVLKDYFTSRSHDLLEMVISVTGHSHYECYAAEWGAKCIGLELGENIAFTQSKMAFARGAARQWQLPWSVQVSPWFHGACTTSGPLVGAKGNARGLDAGHSLSLYERLWLHSWFAGTAMVTPENSLAIFFEQASKPWSLTSHGEKAIEVFKFMEEHDRGIPWTPVAILLDHYAGYNAYMDKPWGILEPTPADREVRDLFDFQLFPGSDHIHRKTDSNNPEVSYLRHTPYGEMFDVLLSSVSAGILPQYQAALLAGEITFDQEFVSRLEEFLKHGRTLLVAPRHRDALGSQFERLSRIRKIEVLQTWINPETGRLAAISNDRLRELKQDLLPIQVAGDPVQYEINKVPSGWVVELVNNDGVRKQPDQPALVDPRATKRITLTAKGGFTKAFQWRSGQSWSPPSVLTVELGPGRTEFVEFFQIQ